MEPCQLLNLITIFTKRFIFFNQFFILKLTETISLLPLRFDNNFADEALDLLP